MSSYALLAAAATNEKLSLSAIRDTLIRQEDTIIFALIERAQYAHNKACYTVDDRYESVTSSESSLLDFMMLETERLHARVGRYAHPDEHAFFAHRLAQPQIPPVDHPPVLHPCLVNLNQDIMDMYIHKALPSLCEPGDDQQHGSSVVADIAVLQAISKRVHYGFYVAESKFQAQEEQYTRLIEAEDEEAIMALLTNATVEEAVLRRVKLKAATFGQELTLPPPPQPPAAATVTSASAKTDDAPTSAPAMPPLTCQSSRVDPELIVKLYRDHVIPLTKVGEVRYLLQRLSSSTIAHHGHPGSVIESMTMRKFVDGQPSGKQAPLLCRCDNAAEVFQAVQSGNAHFGVVLMEVGDSGVLHATRRLLETSPLRVVGDISHQVQFTLVSTGALTLVRRVRGRADALRLCSDWLRQLLSHAAEEEEVVGATPWEGTLDDPDYQSTAYLVEVGAQLHPSLKSLAVAPIEFTENMRCVVLSKPRQVDSGPSGHDKTMVLFSVIQDRIGSLADALAIFNRQGVNIRFIQSYANSKERSAVFFAEVDGHERDEALSTALNELREQAASLKILGSFAVPSTQLATAA